MVKSTKQALEASFELHEGGEYWSHKFGQGYELTFERRAFGEFAVALYQDENLLIDKVPVREVSGGVQ